MVFFRAVFTPVLLCLVQSAVSKDVNVTGPNGWSIVAPNFIAKGYTPSLTMCTVTKVGWTGPKTKKDKNFWIHDDSTNGNRTSNQWRWVGAFPKDSTHGIFPLYPHEPEVFPGFVFLRIGDDENEWVQIGGYNLVSHPTLADDCKRLRSNATSHSRDQSHGSSL
ncbi:hypothetical protein T439DRAFT_356982 [Meredithblackwellia eburnea MCA 4105]